MIAQFLNLLPSQSKVTATYEIKKTILLVKYSISTKTLKVFQLIFNSLKP